MSDNPFKMIKTYNTNNRHRIRYLDEEEMKALLANCPKSIKPLVLVAANTGMRRGEIFNLKWTDVDFTNKLLYIRDSKSGKQRSIPLNEMLSNLFINLRIDNKGGIYVFPGRRGPRFVNIQRPFKKAVEGAGIKDFRFHDLRHTFASHLVMKGVNLKAVQELLGHADLRMTMRYSHLDPNYKRQAVELIGADIERLSGSRDSSHLVATGVLAGSEKWQVTKNDSNIKDI